MTWVPILANTDVTRSFWQSVESLIQSDETYLQCSDCDFELPLLCAYLARARNDLGLLTHGICRLNVATQAMFQETYCGLYSGLCGLGWTIDHLSRFMAANEHPQFYDSQFASANSDGPDLNADVDTFVIRTLRDNVWRGPIDLVTGLVGFGIYFLGRLKSANSLLGIQLVLYHLEESCTSTREGIRWQAESREISSSDLNRVSDVEENSLGIAHGIAGMIYFLTELIGADIEEVKARRLLNRAVEHLITKQQSAESAFRSGSDGPPVQLSLSWCNGSLGIASVLLRTAERLGNTAWRTVAWRLLESCVLLPIKEKDLDNVSLYSGALGVAHMFNRIFQKYCDPTFRTASVSWFEAALSAYTSTKTVGSFRAIAARNGSEKWTPHASALLTGWTGMALALLAASTPISPDWDRLLLLS